jgi:hypothetical protein
MIISAIKCLQLLKFWDVLVKIKTNKQKTFLVDFSLRIYEVGVASAFLPLCEA